MRLTVVLGGGGGSRELLEQRLEVEQILERDRVDSLRRQSLGQSINFCINSCEENNLSRLYTTRKSGQATTPLSMLMSRRKH